jgi:uncharacterized damage-inducible protein DinB
MRNAVILSVVLAAGAYAQAPDLKTLAGGAKAYQNQVKGVIQRSAEKMPDDQYSFKPTPDVRSFGQVIGHVADAQYTFCSAALGEKNPAPGIEKSKQTKAELVSALQEAFAYCDKAYSALTDANAGEAVKFGNGERSRLNVLSFSTMHNFEHYGNLVTYMRLKGIVPPSSEPRK